MKRVIIETDFEPDDQIAVVMVVAAWTEPHQLFLVVGESKAHLKMAWVTEFVRLMEERYPNLVSTVILEGLPSEKFFPGLAEFGEATPREKILADHEALYDRVENVECAYWMKPPREALKWGIHVHCAFPVVVYGSFNWRTLETSVENLRNLHFHFTKLIYVDSFSVVGEKNSYVFPERPRTQLGQFIAASILRWNGHIAREQLDKLLVPNLPAEKRARHVKVLTNVLEGGPAKQFVLADVCLPLALSKPAVWAKLTAFKDYPVWEKTESEPGDAFILDVDKTAFREELIRTLDELFAEM